MQLVLEFAGPASEVRVERISRDCFRDGGALAEVMAFYKAKGERDAAASVKVEENVDPGLEVDPLLRPPGFTSPQSCRSFLLSTGLMSPVRHGEVSHKLECFW